MYSGLIMNYGTKVDFMCSLERINPLKGYTKDNVCLICNEFNTSDKTAKRTNLVQRGSAGWNHEKCQKFIQYIFANY